MSVALVQLPAETHSDTPDTCHLTCCVDIRRYEAFCGEDLTDSHPWRPGDQDCVVCVDLDGGAFCPWTGELCPEDDA